MYKFVVCRCYFGGTMKAQKVLAVNLAQICAFEHDGNQSMGTIHLSGGQEFNLELPDFIALKAIAKPEALTPTEH